MHILYNFCIIFFCILTVQCAEVDNLKSVSNQVNDLVFADYFRFSHEDLMSFGLTCKSNHIYLQVTAEKRKEYILQYYPTVLNMLVPTSLSWHGYGSRADYKRITEDIKSTSTGKKLYIGRLELIDGGKVRKYLGKWRNFDSELSYKPAPFYTTNKELRFFGFGWENVPDWGLYENIICYQTEMIEMGHCTLWGKHSPDAVRCVLCLCKNKKNNNESTVGVLLEYPYLLQAILKKGPVKKRIIPSLQKDDCYYLYHIKDILIPDNYKELVQHWSDHISYSSFDKLPFDLQNAITKQYKKS